MLTDTTKFITALHFVKITGSKNYKIDFMRPIVLQIKTCTSILKVVISMILPFYNSFSIIHKRFLIIAVQINNHSHVNSQFIQ